MATAKKNVEVPVVVPDVPTAEDNGDVVFVDELPADRVVSVVDGKYAKIARQLRENPGRWANIYTAVTRNGARTRVYQLRRRYPTTEGYTFEFRSPADDTHSVFARWNDPAAE